VEPLIKQPNRLKEVATEIVDEYAVNAMYWSYGFIFFFFGLQKPAPAVSPPKFPISSGLSSLGINLPVEYVMLFIGAYEMVLGLIFLFRKIKIASWLFWPHQLIAFLTLFLIPFEIFQPPWLEIGSYSVPWLLDSFSAFVLKNLIFVAAFILLYKNEVLDKESSEEKEKNKDEEIEV
jgi:hypothetical protein